jgi:hypothetical protein
MRDTVSTSKNLLACSDSTCETWAILAGQGLGAVDKTAGVFDDTPPSEVPEEHAATYRSSYCQINPDYAIG